MTKTRPPGNPDVSRRTYSAGRVAPGPPRADPLPYSNTAERERRLRELQARGLLSDEGFYGPVFDDEDEASAPEVQPAPPRRLSLKEEISRPNYDPKAYPHDGPPKRPVSEAGKTTINDELSELTRQQDLVKSVPNTLVSLQSVAAVLGGILHDEQSVLAVCESIADEDRAKQKKRAAPLPEVAPKLWVDRDKMLGENPGEFVTRIYGDMLDDLHTGALQRLDKALSVAYARWAAEVAKGKEKPLPGHPLPTSDEWKDRQPPLTPEQMEQAQRQLWRERKQQQRDRAEGEAVPPASTKSASGEKITRAKLEGRAEWNARDKSQKEEAGAFVDRVYKDLIHGDAVFHTGTLQSYDKSLSVAYDRWVEKVKKGKTEPIAGHPLPDSGRVRGGEDDDRPPPTEQDRRWVLRHLARDRKAARRST